MPIDPGARGLAAAALPQSSSGNPSTATGGRVGITYTNPTTGMTWTLLDNTPGQALWKPTRTYDLMPVGSRFSIPYAISGAGFNQTQCRKLRKNGPVAKTNLRAYFSNFYCDYNGTEINNGNSIVVNSAIEYPIGAARRSFTKSGGTNMQIARGDILETDILPITIPANAWYAEWTWVDAGTAGTYPFEPRTRISNLFGAESDAVEAGTGLTNKVLSGTITNAGSNAFYSATLITGEAMQWAPSYCLLGDSITAGYNGWNLGEGDANGNVSGAERLFGAVYDTFNLGVGGTGIFQQVDAYALNNRRRRALLAMTGSHLFLGFGHNDLFNYGRTLQQWKDDMASVIQDLLPYNKRVIVPTLTPKTTSASGNWTSAADQTADANSALMVAANAWIRAKSIPGMDYYVEFSTPAAAPGIETKWNFDGTADKYTDDGAHPTNFTYAAMAAANNVYAVR